MFILVDAHLRLITVQVGLRVYTFTWIGLKTIHSYGLCLSGLKVPWIEEFLSTVCGLYF